MWDLYTKQEVATFQLGWCASASNLSKPPRYISHRFLCDCPGAQNVLHGAWGTIALDTRSAYELPLDEDCDFIDVSDQKKRFKVSETTSHQYHPDTDDEEDSTDDEEIEAVSEATETDNDEEDIDSNHQLLGMTFEELAQSVSVVSTVSFATCNIKPPLVGCIQLGRRQRVKPRQPRRKLNILESTLTLGDLLCRVLV